MSIFRFKQFNITQSQSAMKVGVDGVLLGAWVSGNYIAANIMDIGTGTGLIAIMMAQRFQQAKILGVEVDPSAATEAMHNTQSSPWGDRITIVETDFLQLPPLERKMDIIVSNPPYFANGWPVSDVGRQKARDAAALPMDKLLMHAGSFAHHETRLCLIIPADTSAHFLQQAEVASWYPEHITTVHTVSGKPAKRSLISCVRQPVVGKQDSLIIHQADGTSFTDAYKQLTRDFYLAF